MEKKLSKDIVYEIKDFDIDNEISLEDIEDIEEFLKNQDTVKIPENLFDNIMKSIDFKESDNKLDECIKEEVNVYEYVAELLFNIKHQISLLDKSFWIISSFIMFSGFLFIINDKINTLVLLAPAVTIYSIYYFYRGIHYNTNEMENVCKYSIYEITLARTIIIIGYNIVFAGILAIGNMIIKNNNLWNIIIITWLSPLLSTYCASLYFFYKKGIVESAVASILIWAGYVFMYYEFFYRGVYVYDKSICIDIYLGLIIISFVMLIMLLKNIRRVYR